MVAGAAPAATLKGVFVIMPGADFDLDGELMGDVRNLIEYCGDVIALVDPEFRFRYVTPSSFATFGWRPEELIGVSIFDLLDPGERDAILAKAQHANGTDIEYVTITALNRRRDGGGVWIEATVRRLVKQDGGTVAVIVMRDITERKKLEQEYAALAFMDGLTGLANRRAFDVELEKQWARVSRDGTPLSLLMLDIDHFKLFNDLYGHIEGDDCLKAVAAAIAGAVREQDTAFRYGGEEMAVILPGADAQGALEAGERLRSAIAKLAISHRASPSGKYLTVSIGAASLGKDPKLDVGQSAEFLKVADKALYAAKRLGRDRVVYGLRGDEAPLAGDAPVPLGLVEGKRNRG